jgi:Bifunctional DNA primase/polymerase, N-terminal.
MDWSFYDRGFSLFPLTPRTKLPAGKWKQYIERRATPDEIAQWRTWPNMNTGVATGAVSGIIVLDCDNLMARIECERQGIPATLTIATPRGTHFYFRHPGWAIGNKVGLMWPGWDQLGVDVRGDGGFVVGPGSYFMPTPAEVGKGKVEGHYAVERDLPLADMPDWLLELTFPKAVNQTVPVKMAEETSAFGRAALNGQLADLAAAGDGNTSHQIYVTTARIAELVAGGEITTEEGWGGLWEILASKGLEDEDKANGTVQRAWAKGFSNPKAADMRPGPVAPDVALGTRAPVAPPPPGPDGQMVAAAPPPPVRAFTPKEKPPFVHSANVREYFQGCAYIAKRDEIFLPSGVRVGRSAFDALYGGPQFCMDIEGSKPKTSAWEMFRQNAHTEMPKAWDICFRPELPSGQIVDIEGLPFLNTYIPLVTPRTAGDASPFVNHVHKLLPDGRDAELLLHWMGSAVQNPGAKFQWWPVVQGTKGNGKSLLLRVMYRAIGERYSHQVRADSVIKTGNQFNDWIVGKLFLGFEEIRSSEGRRDFVEIMKDTVTAERMATEGKGAGQTTSDNRANGLMLTNHDDACPIDDDERRWGIFFCAQQSEDDMARDGMTMRYFEDLYDWLNKGGYAVVTHYLATRPLEYALDPARGLQRAPETTSTRKAVTESLGVVEQEILDAIESGTVGFRHGIVSSLAMRSLFERLRKTIGPRRYRKIMATVGYLTHPGLETNKGRPNNPMRDGTRPTLYFAKESPLLAISDPAELMEAVEAVLAGSPSVSGNVVHLRTRQGPSPAVAL